MGTIRAALVENSPRLQRVLGVLSSGEKLSTRDIIEKAHVAAVNSCIHELRDPINGSLDIQCERKGDIWTYQLRKGA